jgi:hypothetical protein
MLKFISCPTLFKLWGPIMRIQWPYFLMLLAGCQASEEITTQGDASLLDEGSDFALPDLSSDMGQADTGEPGPVPPSFIVERECLEILNPNTCEWANASDNVLYWRVNSVNVVTDVVTSYLDSESNDTVWMETGFGECERPNIAIEIKAEALWSWLPIPSNEVSIILGPGVLSDLGSPVYWDTATNQMKWRTPNIGFEPGTVIGAALVQHPDKENQFILRGPLFGERAGQMHFYSASPACIEVPPSLETLDFEAFKDPDSPLRASQATKTWPPNYSTRCNLMDVTLNGCRTGECFHGYVCEDTQCVCPPEVPNCP